MTSRHEQNKKEHEEVFVRRFLSLPGWNASVERADESPDFIVPTAGRLLGVEVTELLKASRESDGGSETRKGESRRARFIRDLADRYYAQAGGVCARESGVAGRTRSASR